MASSVEVEEEASIVAAQEVNSGSYLTLHNAQVYRDGLSFSGNERNKVWFNAGGGRFTDMSDLSGADSPNDSRAVIAADFDADGDADLFVHSIQRERHALYRNDAVRPGEANFLAIRLRATKGQHEAIGATVVVHGPAGPTAQVLTRGAGFASCQPPELLFGLGRADQAEVEVLWPGGARESFGSLAAGTRALLVEGARQPRSFAVRPLVLPDPLPPGLKLAEGDIVPTFVLLDAEGEPRAVDVREIAGGKPLMLNLWASFCAPCVAELPLLQERHASDDVRVLAISVDVPADAGAARALLERAGAGFEAYYIGAADVPGAAGDLGAVPFEDLIDLERLTIPTTMVLDARGRVESILRGPLRD